MESAEDIQDLIRERIDEHEHQLAHMIGHMKYLAMKTTDYHGTMDASADVREIEAAINALREFAGPGFPGP